MCVCIGFSWSHSGNSRFNGLIKICFSRSWFHTFCFKCKVVWWKIWDLEKSQIMVYLYCCFYPSCSEVPWLPCSSPSLWCIEELFVVKSSEVLIMMVSKLVQAGAAALDTKSTASPDVSWFLLQAPSPASCVTVDNETCLFHVLILSVPKFLSGRICNFFIIL